MTRSEDELHVGTAARETGRARLRKYVVTETVEETVPVRREEVRVEREPITDANPDAALEGPEITEAEHEVTLHAEEPVVEKSVVPKERVRLDKDVVEDEHQVPRRSRRSRSRWTGTATATAAEAIVNPAGPGITPGPAPGRAPHALQLAEGAAVAADDPARASRSADVLDDMDAYDGSDTRVTR